LAATGNLIDQPLKNFGATAATGSICGNARRDVDLGRPYRNI